MPKYTLFYWDRLPGRGEYIRLAFEYTRTPFSESNSFEIFSKHLSPEGTNFAPPLLQVTDDTGDLVLSQTPAILAHIAPALGLAGSNEREKATVNQLTLTALDLSNEAHDVYQPLGPSLPYDKQKPEAKRRADDFTTNRIPKFLTHFETVLEKNNTGLLVGSAVSTADLTLFYVVGGLLYAYPKRMKALQSSNKYTRVFKLHEKIKGELKDYLASERRLDYSADIGGVYMYHAELDQE